jgi:replicative DNA helicase
VKTDFLCLEEVIAGFRSASLGVLATDSPLGHAFALSLGFDIAVAQRIGVMVFNLDKSEMDVVSRRTYFEARAGQDASSTFAPILFDDRPASSLNEIQARVRQFKAQDRTLRLLIIGGLEPLWHRGELDVEEAERVVEGLRELSRGLDLTVLALAPLSSRSAKRPSSGNGPTTMLALQKADFVLLLQGEEVYDWHATGRHLAEITLLKPGTNSAQSCRLGISEDRRFGELPAAC